MNNKMFIKDVNDKTRYTGRIIEHKKNLGVEVVNSDNKVCKNINEVYICLGLSYGENNDFKDVYLVEFEVKNNGIIKYKDIVKVPYYSNFIDFGKNKISNQIEEYFKLIESDKIDISRLLVGYVSDHIIFKFKNCSTYDSIHCCIDETRYSGFTAFITEYLYNKNILSSTIIKPLIKDIKHYLDDVDLSLRKGNFKSKIIRKYMLWLMDMVDDLKDKEWLKLSKEIQLLTVEYDY